MSAVNIRSALYEKPGPKARKLIAVLTAVSIVLILLLIYAVIERFYESGQLSPRYWSIFTRKTTWRFMGAGLSGTVRAALMGGVIAFAAGFVYMVMRICKYRILNILAACLTEFFRGVPTLLFIYFFFLVIPRMGIKMSAFWKVALPVGLSASGVVSEVLRSGVNAVPKGQREAALSIGMREVRTFIKIIFPEAMRYVIPSLIAELVIVLKDTTFAYIVSYADLMQNAMVLISNYDALVAVYLVVALIYIIINYLLNRASVYISKKTGVKIEV